MDNINWIPQLSAEDWPEGVLEDIDPFLINEVVIPLRMFSNIPFYPSPKKEDHVLSKSVSGNKTTIILPECSYAVTSILRYAIRLPTGFLTLSFVNQQNPTLCLESGIYSQLLLSVNNMVIKEWEDSVSFYRNFLKQLILLEGHSWQQ